MIRGPEGSECHALPGQTENLPERPPGSLFGDKLLWGAGAWERSIWEERTSFQGARGGPRRRRVPTDQGSRKREALPRGGRCGHARRGRSGLSAGPEVPGLRRPRCLEGRLHRRRRPEVALPLLQQEVQLPHGHRPRALPKAAPRLGLLHQAQAPQRPRRVRSRAVRRHPQDHLRVAAPRARHSIRLPGPDRAGIVNETDVSNIVSQGFGGRAPRTQSAATSPTCASGPRGTTYACSSTSTTGKSSAIRRARRRTRGSSRPRSPRSGSRSRTARCSTRTAAASSTTPISTSCSKRSASNGRSRPKAAPTTTPSTSQQTRYSRRSSSTERR